LIRELGRDPSAGRAVQKADLDQKRLVDFFDGVGFFGQRRAQRIQTHRPTLVLLDDGEQQFAVDLVEAVAVYFKHAERGLGGGQIDGTGGAHLGVVAYAAQQAVGDAWRSTRAAGDFGGSGTVDFHTQDFGGTLDDDAQVIVSVELKPQQQAETRAQGRGEQSGARGGADEGEGLYIHRVRARGWALADHDVELVVFERGVEDLFQRRLQTMHFINEKHLPVTEIGEDRGQVALDLQRGAGSLLEGGAELVGDDVGQRSFAEAGRSVEQDVVERLTARLGRLDGDVEILFYLVLADEFLQTLRAKLELKRRIVLNRGGGD